LNKPTAQATLHAISVSAVNVKLIQNKAHCTLEVVDPGFARQRERHKKLAMSFMKF
jgi:hypothetical protein